MTTKPQRLGCTATCPILLRDSDKPLNFACTPHESGLCVVLFGTLDCLRVTHVASGQTINNHLGDYPATKPGMTAALHELRLLLKIADWTQPADALQAAAVDANLIARRCRAAFPGKLVGNVVHRDVAEPPADVVKWRIYDQDDEGAWSFVDIAHTDHLLGAVGEALTKFDGPRSFDRRDVPTDIAVDQLLSRGLLATRRHAFDFGRVLHVGHVDGGRIVIVLPTPDGLALCCDQLFALHDELAAAKRALAGVNNPRRTLGVWKSGPKLGAIKLPAKLPPEQCIEVLAQQERYDAQARKVEQLTDGIRELELHFGTDEPLPECIMLLRPAETPDGKQQATEMMEKLQALAVRLCSVKHFIGRCLAQLESGLREYESVEERGFAPRSRCIMVADPHEPDDVDRQVEITGVRVTKGTRWFGEDTWYHERDVLDLRSGEETTVAVERLKTC